MWSALGVLFVRFGRLAGRMTLKWHGAVYLVASLAASGIAGATARLFVLGDAHADALSSNIAGWTAGAAGLVAFALVMRGRAPDGASWNFRLLTLVLAGNAAWATIGILAKALVEHGGGATSLANFYPTILTGMLTAVTAALAVAATRFERPELVWLTYAFIGVATYKLVVHDLRQGQTMAIVLSLLLYGGMLVLLPRMLQRPRRIGRETANAS
jgi:hypothetical protein